MGVRPALRRLGIGRRLIEHGEHWALTQGVEYLQVKTLSERRPHAGYAATCDFYLGSASGRLKSSQRCGARRTRPSSS